MRELCLCIGTSAVTNRTCPMLRPCGDHQWGFGQMKFLMIAACLALATGAGAQTGPKLANGQETAANTPTEAVIVDQMLSFRARTQGRFRGTGITLIPGENRQELVWTHQAIDAKRENITLRMTSSGRRLINGSRKIILTAPIIGDPIAVAMFETCRDVLLQGTSAEVSRARFIPDQPGSFDNTRQGFPKVQIVITAAEGRRMAEPFRRPQKSHLLSEPIVIALDDDGIGKVSCEMIAEF